MGRVSTPASGSQARFEEIARGLIEPLRRFLVRRTDPDTAADVLADTLLVCWRRREDLPGTTSEEALPWAYGVARNALANADRGVRRQQRLAARIATVDPPVETAPETPDFDELNRALAALPPAQAELLRLWAWEELGAAEIAQVLDISANAASIRLHRAKANLRDEIERPRKIDPGAGHETAEEGRPR